MGSVPRSHRSQGPIGPPRYPTQGIPPKGSLGTHIWYGYIHMDISSGIIQWHWNKSVARSFLQRLSISSTLSHNDPPTAPSIIDCHRSSTFYSMEFHWIQWNSIGSNGIPLDPMEFHRIQWNSNSNSKLEVGWKVGQASRAGPDTQKSNFFL